MDYWNPELEEWLRHECASLGRPVAEGAYALLLEEADGAAARGARVLAEIGTSARGFDLGDRTPELAERVARDALGGAAPDLVLDCGEPAGAPGGAPRCSLRDFVGEGLGARGALGTALASLAIHSGAAPSGEPVLGGGATVLVTDFEPGSNHLALAVPRGRERRGGLAMDDQRVVLVTGGSRGIGREIVRTLAGQGARVAFTYRENAAAAESLVKELAPANPHVAGFACDATDLDAVKATVKEVASRLGPITGLVNNAGITRDRPFVMMKPEEWHEVIDTDLTGTFNFCRAVIFSMSKRKVGKIVNIGSISGLVGNVGQVNYAAAKAGLVGFTQGAGPRDGALGHHRERGRAGLHRDRHDQGHSREDAGGPRRGHPPRAARQGERGGEARRVPAGRRRRLHHRPGLHDRRRDGHMNTWPHEIHRA